MMRPIWRRPAANAHAMMEFLFRDELLRPQYMATHARKAKANLLTRQVISVFRDIKLHECYGRYEWARCAYPAQLPPLYAGQMPKNYWWDYRHYIYFHISRLSRWGDIIIDIHESMLRCFFRRFCLTSPRVPLLYASASVPKKLPLMRILSFTRFWRPLLAIVNAYATLFIYLFI